MKKIIICLIFLFSILAACEEVVEFEFSIPKNAKELYEFPQMFLGTYLINDGCDTLQVYKEGLRVSCSDSTIFGHRNTRNLKENDLELKRFENYYILNFEMETKIETDSSPYFIRTWTIYPFILEQNQLIVYSVCVNKEYENQCIDKLKNITSVKEIKYGNGSIDKYLIDPSNKELKRMFKEKVFLEGGIWKKIK